MDLIYLDYNCFQRGFDDPHHIKIQIEALACEEIFAMAEREEIRLIWSFCIRMKISSAHLWSVNWKHSGFHLFAR